MDAKSMKTISTVILVVSVVIFGYSQIDSTYHKLNKALSDARNQKDFIKLAHAYYEIGVYEEKNFSKSDHSFEYFTNAKQYFDVNGDTHMSKIVELAIAKRYQKSGLYQESIDLYASCLEYFKNKNDSSKIAHIYFDLSKVYEDKGDNEVRIRNLQYARQYNAVGQDSTLFIDILIENVDSYESLNEIDSAIFIVDYIIETSKNMGYPQGISMGYYHLARLEKSLSNYQRALRAIEESEAYIPMQSYDPHRRDIYDLMAQLYHYRNKNKKAFFYEQKYASLNDSILTKERIQSSNNLTLKYQLNEKNSNIKLLEIENNYAIKQNNQQRRILYLLGSGVFLLLVSIYFIINFYRQKMKSDAIIRSQDEELNKQKLKELEGQYHINNLQSMIEGQEIERERIAKDLHDSLGGLLSAVKLQFDAVKNRNEVVSSIQEYASANKMLDIAVDEVRTISQNLQPGSLKRMGLVTALRDLFNRFHGDTYPEIDFQTYDLPEKMDNMIALSIYRIIQELLYNALKHAKASEILIQINREGDELIIQFEDDGVGYDPDNLSRKGMGLENIKSRIQYLKGDMAVDSRPGEGTSVILHLRYK